MTTAYSNPYRVFLDETIQSSFERTGYLREIVNKIVQAMRLEMNVLCVAEYVTSTKLTNCLGLGISTMRRDVNDRTLLVRCAMICLAILATAAQPVYAVGPQGDADTFVSLLAAGDFQAASELASAQADDGLKSEMISQLAAAQMKASQPQAAMAVVGTLTNRVQRKSQQADLSTQQALQGSGADFTQLINLIQTETGDDFSWDAAGGVGSISPFDRGVRVDAHGLLSVKSQRDATNNLDQIGAELRSQSLNQDLTNATDFRMISLKALESAVAQQLAAGQPVVSSLKNLGGMYRVDYVLIDAANHDVILGGPAGAWKYDQNGTAVSVVNGQPVLQLDDLVTLTRVFSAEGLNIFGCSIDPREEGMKKLKEFVAASSNQGALSPGQVKSWVSDLQEQLGLQDIRFYGVPADSRVARVIIEADYRMKLIGVGKLDGGQNIPSYFDLMTTAEQKSGSLDALRWWLTVQCDAVTHNESRSVFAIDNCSVLCQSENQFVSAQGQSIPTGKADATNQLFAQNLTNNYADLASRDTVFADLKNVFDLALVAAIMHREHASQRADFDAGCFAVNGAYRPQSHGAPKVVDSVVNHRVYRGKDIVVQVAGGVRADVMSLFEQEDFLTQSPRLDELKSDIQSAQRENGQWWWDAK